MNFPCIVLSMSMLSFWIISTAAVRLICRCYIVPVQILDIHFQQRKSTRKINFDIDQLNECLKYSAENIVSNKAQWLLTISQSI